MVVYRIPPDTQSYPSFGWLQTTPPLIAMEQAIAVFGTKLWWKVQVTV
jgi:hypothetical protein